MRSAIINSGYEYPVKKITINLAPADLPKRRGRSIYLSPLRCGGLRTAYSQ
ncbi:magnesium chelatase domain-containing protein [Shigella flexneri]